MKRAEVWKDDAWLFAVWDGEIPGREKRIPERDSGLRHPILGGDFPTHAEALTYALAAVGLAPENTEKENTMENDISTMPKGIEDTSEGQCDARITVQGQYYRCDYGIHHDGWAHGSTDAGIIWQGGTVTR